MSRSTRRQFLGRSLAASTVFSTFTIAGTKSSGKVLGANDTVRIGVAGINGRGDSHMKAFSGAQGKEKNTQVTYLIDPDSRLFDKNVKMIRERSGNTPKCVQDVRKALEDPNLDAISIATPNHWHALMTIWACEHGKDVYVEKPCSHNVHEGRIAVKTARKHGRIVQHGTQSRSSPHWNKVIAAVHSGKYGKLVVARGYSSKPRKSIGFQPNKAPPKELDFNIWLGPAPEQPYHENLVHYEWHWMWDTGNGEIGNQGVHQMDIARWGIPGAGLPKSVISFGGRFGYEDQGQTPNTQCTIYDYDDALLIFEVRGLVDGQTKKVDNEFYLTEGKIIDGKFFPLGSNTGEPLDVDIDLRDTDPFGNFVNAVRSRRHEDLNADILEGHLSSALCHLGNISYRLGSDFSCDGKGKAMAHDRRVALEIESMKHHLTEENGIKLEGLTGRMGRRLLVDAERETFVNDDEAVTLLTRNYRGPFVVPEDVSGLAAT